MNELLSRSVSLMSAPVCNFYVRTGSCKFGASCKYIHPYPNGSEQEFGGFALQEGPRAAGARRAAAPRPAEPAYKTRAWWTAGVVAPAGPPFRVMSYNVLADELAQSHRWELYRGTHPDLLSWGLRWSMIKQEVEDLTPDLVCMQEVDHWDEVCRDMAGLGFTGTYAQRSGGRGDGCATFWRTACFESVAISQLKFSDFDLKDNVGLLTLLRYKQQQQAEPQRSRQEQRRLDRQLQRQQVRRMQERERQWQQLRQQQRKGQEQDFSSSSSSSSSDDSDSDSDLPHARRAAGQAAAAGPFIAVANTHTLFNPKRGDIKLGQLRLLIKHLQALLSASLPPEQVPAVAALVIGDMNHQPHTPIYNFMRQGWLDCLQQHRKAMAGTQDDLCINRLARRTAAGGRPGSFNGSQQQRFGGGQSVFQQQQQRMFGNAPGGCMMPHQQDRRQQQHHHQQQQYGFPAQLPPAAPLGMVPPGMPLPPPAGMQPPPQQQVGMLQQLQGHHLYQQHGQSTPMQPEQEGQREGLPHAGMHRSASAPAVLTLRRLKNAGWSAEELVTATGGAHGTHLKHYLQQEQDNVRQQKRRQPKLQGAAEEEDMDLTDDSSRGPAWQQPGLQQFVAQVRYSAAQDLAVGDSGDDMDLSSDPPSRAAAAAAAAGDSDMELGSDDERQRRQQNHQGDKCISPDTELLKKRHQKAVKAQMKQHARACEALQLQGAGREELQQLRQQQKQEAAALKKQHQQQMLQHQQDRQQHQQQGMSGSYPHKKQKGSSSAALPPPPPAGLQQQQQQQLVPPPPPPMPGAEVLPPPPPPPAPLGQQQQQWPQDSMQLLRPVQQQAGGSPFTLADAKSWGRDRWDEPLPPALGDGVARHGLQLRSCYAELTGSEPEYTSCHDSFYGTVDYIWYTPQAAVTRLTPVAVLLPPDAEQHLVCMARPCMPNATMPSDHIALVCDFELFQADEAGADASSKQL